MNKEMTGAFTVYMLRATNFKDKDYYNIYEWRWHLLQVTKLSKAMHFARKVGKTYPNDYVILMRHNQPMLFWKGNVLLTQEELKKVKPVFRKKLKERYSITYPKDRAMSRNE